MQNLSRLHDAAEGADFPKIDPDPVGVPVDLAKTKIAYNGGDFSGVHNLCLLRLVCG